MKRFKSIAILLATVAAMASCDLLNVDVDTTFSATVDVDVPEETFKGTMEWTPFSADTTLYPGDNQELADNAGLIVEVGVNNVDVVVTSLSVEELSLAPQSLFSLEDGTNTASWYSDEEWTLSLYDTLQIDDKNGFYADLETILDVPEEDIDDAEWTFHVSGNCSQGGVSFKLKLVIDATFTGSIL